MNRSIWLAAALALAAAHTPAHADPLSWMMGGYKPGAHLDDATERQIIALTRDVGRVAATAIICRQRDMHWLNDLEEEVAIDAVSQLVKDDDSGRITSAVMTSAEGYMKGAERMVAEDAAEDGVKGMCPVSAKDADLKHADALVKKHRAPHDWSGLGGK